MSGTKFIESLDWLGRLLGLFVYICKRRDNVLTSKSNSHFLLLVFVASFQNSLSANELSPIDHLSVSCDSSRGRGMPVANAKFSSDIVVKNTGFFYFREDEVAKDVGGFKPPLDDRSNISSRKCSSEECCNWKSNFKDFTHFIYLSIFGMLPGLWGFANGWHAKVWNFFTYKLLVHFSISFQCGSCQTLICLGGSVFLLRYHSIWGDMSFLDSMIKVPFETWGLRLNYERGSA